MLLGGFVLFIIALLRIFKLKLLIRIQSDSKEKSLQLVVLLCNFKVSDNKFTALTDEEKNLIVNQYKRGKLKKEYTLKALANKIKYLTKDYKRNFDLVEKKLFDTFKRFFVRRVKIEDLSLQLKLGLSDAFFTAISAGAVYVIINALLSRLYIKKKPKKAEIDVKPDFQKTMLEAHVAIMISVRASALFTIGTAVVLLFLRNKSREKRP